jgi:hypothetical protein
MAPGSMAPLAERELASVKFVSFVSSCLIGKSLYFLSNWR